MVNSDEQWLIVANNGDDYQVNVYIAMENHHLEWGNPLYMANFNSYVKLPEGRWIQWMYMAGNFLNALFFFESDVFL